MPDRPKGNVLFRTPTGLIFVILGVAPLLVLAAWCISYALSLEAPKSPDSTPGNPAYTATPPGTPVDALRYEGIVPVGKGVAYAIPRRENGALYLIGDRAYWVREETESPGQTEATVSTPTASGS